jgi:hypothetical protein
VAGRVPGTRPSDTEGFNSYTRPEGKSGGHGVGWSEIPRYSFEVSPATLHAINTHSSASRVRSRLFRPLFSRRRGAHRARAPGGSGELPALTRGRTRRAQVPEDWEETPVSIADLGGAEVDLRFGFKPEGDLAVVVAPVLRFADVGYNVSRS